MSSEYKKMSLAFSKRILIQLIAAQVFPEKPRGRPKSTEQQKSVSGQLMDERIHRNEQ